jgi:conjugal transfer pilus assembly protein TraB
MSEEENAIKQSNKKKKQKLFSGIIFGVFIVGIVTIAFWPESPQKTTIPKGFTKEAFPHQNPNFNPEKIRLSRLEQQNENFEETLKNLETTLEQAKEDKELLEKKNKELSLNQNIHSLHLKSLGQSLEKQEQQRQKEFSEPRQSQENALEVGIWSKPTLSTKRNVVTEIPAGTVVKCLLVSSADCSVGINTASDPNTVLLQPIANGKLPKKVQVALKGSRILGTAVGDIASERVRIRTERLTLMQGSSGDFVETSIAGFVSGEDGKEGLRGTVVDRSGAIISRAAFASFLQGVGASIQATLNNQTLEKVSKVGGTQSILDVDTFRNAGIGGANTGLNKLAEYYIKRAEQLQPVIQVQAGRVVDVIFLKTVKLGEKDIQKTIEKERSMRQLP